MLNSAQQQKVARQSTIVLLNAIKAFPDMLARCEADVAAAIVAGLIRTQLEQPAAEPEPDDSLRRILDAISNSTIEV